MDHAKSPEGAVDGAKWIRLHDKLRSPTDDVIFRPPASDLKQTILELMKEKDFDEQRDAILKHGLSVEKLNVSGHVGALYLEYDGERKAAVRGTDRFHNRLEAFFDDHKLKTKPEDYGAELALEIQDKKSPAAIWDGNVTHLLPAEFETDENYASFVPSSYTSKGGGKWGENLWKFKQEVKEKYRTTRETLLTTKP